MYAGGRRLIRDGEVGVHLEVLRVTANVPHQTTQSYNQPQGVGVFDTPLHIDDLPENKLTIYIIACKSLLK